MSKLTKPISNNEPRFRAIQLINAILTIYDKEEFKYLGIVSAFFNTLPTRIKCPKCERRIGRTRSRIFKNCKQLAHHLVKVHKIDSEEFPTLEQSVYLVEVYSIMLQLKMVNES